MKHVATSDRNAYDRGIFHLIDPEGHFLLILGLGVYPNLGVIDAYATLRTGSTLHAVRACDALSDEARTRMEVGPLHVHVERPLQDFVLTCAADPDDPGGLAYEITWHADFPALWEPRHTQRRGGRLILEGTRFVQAGHCDGWLRIGGREIEVRGWTGTRDRSWGVRPVPGEEGGRLSDEHPTEGFHWIWAPVRFDDRFLMVVVQEDADGHRTLNDATLVREGHRDRQLGWPRTEIDYHPGTRHPRGAVLHLTDPVDRKPLELGVDILTSSPLALGAGYPPADDWQHGTWRGRGWTDRRAYDLSDPAAHPLAAYGVTDHAARFTLDGQVGLGIFEHGSFGRHDPSGFTGFDAVAPRRP
ncbi:hypothetical protein ACIRF8_30045 [Streptomyces sp. NPDC102406]|uniref:hypothetical protein n=1 Tax=Streptomyces sp. NPDC102406 TaxID=3366171 RepID=UPI003819EFAF